MRSLRHLPLVLVALGAVSLAACDAASDTATADTADATAVLSSSDGTVDARDGGHGGTSGGSRVFAVSNPTGAAQDSLVRLSSALDRQAALGGFAAQVTSVQNVTLDMNGAGYLTVDLAPTTGGILVVDRLCGRRGCSADSGAVGTGSRLIAGAATGLVAPKGLLLARGSIIVADNGGAGAIRVFRQNATGDAAPQFVVTNTGGANVWDVAYDQSRDRLFVAATNGTVLVYDRFFRDRGTAGPTRTITPSDAAGVKVSVNLHGIAYDARSRTLVLSDVGSATSATDGQLFTVANGDTASGNVAVRYRNTGGTQLGNPVDLVLDGRDVLVAEKSNDLLLRYTGILSRTGTDGALAEDSARLVKAESVALSGPTGRGGSGGGPGGGHGSTRD